MGRAIHVCVISREREIKAKKEPGGHHVEEDVKHAGKKGKLSNGMRSRPSSFSQRRMTVPGFVRRPLTNSNSTTATAMQQRPAFLSGPLCMRLDGLAGDID